MALYQKQTNKQTYVSQMPLDVGYLRSFYERSGHRLLLLDYDGTLMPHIPLAQLAQVSGKERLSEQKAPRINISAIRHAIRYPPSHSLSAHNRLFDLSV